MTLVLDSSVTLAWALADEVTQAVEELFERVATTYAMVPALWRLEVANGLTMGVRRARLAAAERDATLADLGALDIRTDPETEVRAWSDTLRLAEQFRLTLYDASYLELAQRRAMPLATLDQELRAAAESCRVRLLGL